LKRKDSSVEIEKGRGGGGGVGVCVEEEMDYENGKENVKQKEK
jgi:hypothetical protein